MKLNNLVLTEHMLIESVLNIIDRIKAKPADYVNVINLLVLFQRTHDDTNRGIIELHSFYQMDDTRLFQLADKVRAKYPQEFTKIDNEIRLSLRNGTIDQHINKLLVFFKGMENNADLKPKTKQGPSLPSKSILQKSKLRMR